MKALQLKAPGDLRLVQVDEPPLSPTDVLLRVQFVGMCGTDLSSFRGTNPLVSFPRIPGHEISATVVETSPDGLWTAGTNVSVLPYANCGMCPSCKRGRPNACQFNQTMGVQRDGAMTEYISVPSSKLFTGHLGLQELCLVEPLTVGFHAVARGRVQSSDVVAVFGCGGVGLGAIAASGFRGAKTIAVDLEDAKLSLATRTGATHTINTKATDLSKELYDLTEDRGPDVIIEAIGSPDTFRAAVDEIAFTGRVVYIGYAKQPVCYDTRLFVLKEVDILGARNAQPEDFRQVIAMLESGSFPVEDTISRIVPMEHAAEALQAWSDAPGQFQKIMVKVG